MAAATGVRRLPIAAFIAIVLVDLAIITVVGELSASGLDHEVRTNEEVVRGLLLPVGASLAFVYAVVAALDGWRPVFVDDRPVQRWGCTRSARAARPSARPSPSASPATSST